ncbi:hypothetical protein CBA19CS42_30575 [Caballeronia novacaledonica]|uniref:Uncharacterized protein n=1 Tax=Caballeronia novacaledonica TaxID=1544861 RepID=A0AA37IHV9_9BURK|nr:hypothetical protein CBA19CS42_30575 [Caballeronia novacaledonica]
MSKRQAMCQMPVQTGRAGKVRGEAARIPASVEACGSRHESGDTWSSLLIDEWIRHRLRVIQLKQWRRGPTIYRELRALGHARCGATGGGEHPSLVA